MPISQGFGAATTPWATAAPEPNASTGVPIISTANSRLKACIDSSPRCVWWPRRGEPPLPIFCRNRLADQPPESNLSQARPSGKTYFIVYL